MASSRGVRLSRAAFRQWLRWKCVEKAAAARNVTADRFLQSVCVLKRRALATALLRALREYVRRAARLARACRGLIRKRIWLLARQALHRWKLRANSLALLSAVIDATRKSIASVDHPLTASWVGAVFRLWRMLACQGRAARDVENLAREWKRQHGLMAEELARQQARLLYVEREHEMDLAAAQETILTCEREQIRERVKERERERKKKREMEEERERKKEWVQERHTEAACDSINVKTVVYEQEVDNDIVPRSLSISEHEKVEGAGGGTLERGGGETGGSSWGGLHMQGAAPGCDWWSPVAAGKGSCRSVGVIRKQKLLKMSNTQRSADAHIVAGGTDECVWHRSDGPRAGVAITGLPTRVHMRLQAQRQKRWVPGYWIVSSSSTPRSRTPTHADTQSVHSLHPPSALSPPLAYVTQAHPATCALRHARMRVDRAVEAWAGSVKAGVCVCACRECEFVFVLCLRFAGAFVLL
jgi:hypothetical protein